MCRHEVWQNISVEHTASIFEFKEKTKKASKQLDEHIVNSRFNALMGAKGCALDQKSVKSRIFLNKNICNIILQFYQH
jgi:hypothetical protein